MTTTVTPTDMKINYQSDFDFLYTPVDCRGETVMFPAPSVDWRVEFRTRDHCRTFTVSCVGGSCTNCFNDNGRIHVVAKDHGLSPGRLVGTMTLLNPNRTYPGGIQRIVDRQPVGIELVTASACYDDPSPSADVVIPIVAVDGRQPLPFRFGVVGDKPAPGHPVFDREYGRFFRPVKDHNAEEIDPADGPYNIYAADGRVIANTDRLFICGHTVYRYTGRELVNVAIEQNPNQRLVSRTPSVNAHPGLVYLDRGFIRLPIHSGENRVSLEGLYCKFGIEHIVPLAEAVTGVEVYDAAGEEVNAEIIGNCVVFNIGEIDPNRAGLVMARLSIDSDGGMCEGNNTAFIGVRYDADNHKIFYQTSARPVPETVQPPTLREAREYTGMEMRGANACFVSGQRRGFLTELWLKRRHGTGSKTRRVGLGLPKKWRHLRNERQWRWRRNRWGMLINRNSFLMRMRHVSGNRCSEWAYFHVNLRRFRLSGYANDITIRPAAQVRT